MFIWRIFLSLLSFFYLTNTHAQFNKIARIALARDKWSVNKKQDLSLLPPFLNTYTKGSVKASLTTQIFIGLEKWLDSKYAFQIGLSGYMSSDETVEGDVLQFGSPDFNNFTYHYKLANQRLLLSSRLLTQFKQILPFVSFEMGSSFNQVSNYSESPLIATAVSATTFNNNQTVSLAYGIGTGFDYYINPWLLLGMSYQYTYLGRIQFKSDPKQLTDQTFSIEPFRSNLLKLELSYVF